MRLGYRFIRLPPNPFRARPRMLVPVEHERCNAKNGPRNRAALLFRACSEPGHPAGHLTTTLLAIQSRFLGLLAGLALLNLLAALFRLVAPPALLTLIIWFVIAFPFLLLERKASHRQLFVPRYRSVLVLNMTVLPRLIARHRLSPK